MLLEFGNFTGTIPTSGTPSKISVYISPLERPERMYQRDRQIVPDFDGAEGLFLRYSKDDFLEGQLGVDAIRFPKTSVNRGLLSEPEDVLFHDDGQYNVLRL